MKYVLPFFIFSDFVKQLLNERHHIPAIRFMFFFNLNNKFSTLEFLKEQIINLRRSAKEKKRFKSQVKACSDPSLAKLYIPSSLMVIFVLCVGF